MLVVAAVVVSMEGTDKNDKGGGSVVMKQLTEWMFHSRGSGFESCDR